MVSCGPLVGMDPLSSLKGSLGHGATGLENTGPSEPLGKPLVQPPPKPTVQHQTLTMLHRQPPTSTSTLNLMASTLEYIQPNGSHLWLRIYLYSVFRKVSDMSSMSSTFPWYILKINLLLLDLSSCYWPPSLLNKVYLKTTASVGHFQGRYLAIRHRPFLDSYLFLLAPPLY